MLTVQLPESIALPFNLQGHWAATVWNLRCLLVV